MIKIEQIYEFSYPSISFDPWGNITVIYAKGNVAKSIYTGKLYINSLKTVFGKKEEKND